MSLDHLSSTTIFSKIVKDTFTLHIRGAGGWTNKLYSFFESEYKRQESGKERKDTPLQKVGRSVGVNPQVSKHFMPSSHQLIKI
jgi:hypothetical protein